MNDSNYDEYSTVEIPYYENNRNALLTKPQSFH